MSTETIWMFDEAGSAYHDATRCQCPRHCGNCWADLDQVRAQRADMIARKVAGPDGPYTDADRISPRARYCSPYCKGRAKRDRVVDRNLASQDRSTR
jgi:hypothetical protein